jgi:hypothetical protein
MTRQIPRIPSSETIEQVAADADALARFDSRVQKSPDGCWLWIGALDRDGYGRFCALNSRIGVHRLAYTRHIGPIPAGLHIDHLCRNRACCNPAHLEAVTPGENAARANRLRLRSHCPQGHPYDATSPRRRDGGRRCLACKREWERQRRLRLHAREVAA